MQIVYRLSGLFLELDRQHSMNEAFMFMAEWLNGNLLGDCQTAFI